MSVEDDIREQCHKALVAVSLHPRKGEREKMLEDLITAAMIMRGITSATLSDEQGNTNDT